MGIGICAHLPAVTGDRDDCASERRAFDAFSQDSVALEAAAAHASAPNTPALTNWDNLDHDMIWRVDA
ncbi:protein binding protein [Hordeum vulgare]|nr:protein binding protein [Hordeum vulgare]